MIQIDFHYEGNIIPFECQAGESILEICKNFCKKASINIKLVIFLYDGKIIEDNSQLRNIINKEDKKQNKMDVFVYSTKENYINENKSLIKKEQTLCPKCGENAKLKIKNYIITIYGCKNNHITENILLEQYDKTQITNEEKIICGFCKKRNKEKSPNKIFYFCGTCKQNLSPIYKDYHSENHNIINYDLKKYICFEHGDNYNSYCQISNKNICIACENDHSNHKIILFGKLMPKKENLKNKIDELKNNFDKLKI